MTFESVEMQAALDRAKSELHALQCKYAAVQAYMDEGCIMLDENFMVLEINVEGLRLDGRSIDELVARTFWELWPAAVGTAVEETYRSVMRDRRPVSLRHHFCGAGPDVWLQMRVCPVPGGVACFYQDVTETIQAEDALKLSDERFRAAIDAIGVMWTNDASGRMAGSQPGWEQLTGQTPAQSQGYGWAQALHPDDMQVTIDGWERAVEAKSVFVGEHRVRRRDGQWRKFSIRAVPVLHNNDVIREWVGVHIDVTEAAKATEALRVADRKKDEFIATLAHELRNPLAPVRAAASILARPDLSPEKIEWCAEIIQRQIGTMAVLLDDLLDVSRITSGRLELRKEPIQAAHVVASAAEIARTLLERKHHILELDIAPSLLPLDVDRVRVTQIMGNLLTNAAKYTDPGGLIRIRAYQVDDWVMFEVADNGIGLAAESIPSLFEMFSQQEDAQDRSEGGLGIGLALTRGLVHLHGGTIEVRSPGLSKGSTFTVRLPAAAVLSLPAEQSGTVQRGRADAGNGKMVLVVDDNVDAAQTLAALLELDGWNTTIAHDAADAVEAAARSFPDFALLDLGLPKVSGYELAAMLRASSHVENCVWPPLVAGGSKKTKTVLR
jgi:PAS domain S-box-containing protein